MLLFQYSKNVKKRFIGQSCKQGLKIRNAKFYSNILIKSGVIVNADSKFKGDILIKNGKIIKVFNREIENEYDSEHSIPENTKIIDANNNFIIPGGIDCHTHMQLPFMGTVAVDDFNIGSKAALAGGTTCFLDFIIPGRDESILKAYDTWRNWADPKVNCDYSLHCAITSWNDQVRKDMAEIVKRGISSFKVFLAYKGALMLNDSEFFHVLERCKELGALCMVHAENGELLFEAQKRMLDLGITGPEAHYLSRPESFEAEATHKAITIAEYVTSPLYIVHVMSKDAADEVIRARNKGNILFAETLAASLGIDGKGLWNKNWDTASGFVMSPPINPDPTTKTHLMKLLQSNCLQTVATDNCTFCNQQKKMGREDFTKIPNGVNGIEDRMSIVWTQGVKQGLLSPSDFVRVTSTNPAQIFNLYPKKGIIKEGADADLVIWNGEKERIISKDTHHQAVDFNIFEGMIVKGVCEMTITNGKVVFENGQFTNYLKPGSGNFIQRKPFGFTYERFDELVKARDPRNFMVNRNEGQIKEEHKVEDEIASLKVEVSKLKKENEYLLRQKDVIKNYFNNENNLTSLENALEEISDVKVLNEIKRILYGIKTHELKINDQSLKISSLNNFEIKLYKINAAQEQTRQARIVRIGAIQNKIILPTTEPVNQQMESIRNKIATIIKAAYHSDVNIICMQECWTTPFFMCTREKDPWLSFAESAINGESTKLLRALAKEYKMVIVSPILEREDVRGVIWNTAVVIDSNGDILGKAHKNHIPRVGDFNESTYYMEGQTGNPVFETEYGKIGVNICYGRHHPLHWQALALNGAEIIFNPSATVSGLSEHLWPIEARNAAIANNVFTVAINRVGTETFPNDFTSGDGQPAHKKFGHFYGSSYITAPEGTRTPGLSRVEDGLLIAEVDLNMIRQVRDKWGFQMTSRTDLYADLLTKYSRLDFEPQVISKRNKV
jgi:dihydropyrimidinase